jgi:hypothetical protein
MAGGLTCAGAVTALPRRSTKTIVVNFIVLA